MIKKILGGMIVFVALQCVLSLPAAAQAPPNCYVTLTWYFPDPMPYGWFVVQSYPGTYAYVIAAMKCPPPADCHCNDASKPISLSTGETFITESDISIPGLGGGLSLTRTWNSTWMSPLTSFKSGMFGNQWRSTYEQRLVFAVDNYLRLIREDSTFWAFGSSAPVSEWVAFGPGSTGATLNTDTSIQLTLANGERRTFDKTTGHLVSIVDRNGNTTGLAYDSAGRLSTVTDAASRTLTFTYGNSNFPNLATSVTSSVGISLSYSYDTQGRLVQVTKPDSTTFSYTYDSANRITTVTDSNGKVLESHTYDSANRGLTGSQANGVQAVTISYP